MTPEVKKIVLEEIDLIMSGSKNVKNVSTHAVINVMRDLAIMRMKIETDIPLSEEERYGLKRAFIFTVEVMEKDLKYVNVLLKTAESLEQMEPLVYNEEIQEQRSRAYANRDELAQNLERYKTIILAI